MPVSIELTTIPIGSQFTSTIDTSTDPPEPADKNDFKVRINLDGNGTGLTLSNLSVSEGSVVSVDGSNSVWEATIRPPETAVNALTFTVEADAFSEGNSETTLDIRVSTDFPDTDAEAPTTAFAHSGTSPRGIAVLPDSIKVLATSSGSFVLLSFAHSGTSLGSETFSQSVLTGLDYINGDYISTGDNNTDVIRVNGQDFSTVRTYAFSQLISAKVFHTRLGVAQTNGANFRIQPYDSQGSSDLIEFTFLGNESVAFSAHQDNLIYNRTHLYEINANDEMAFLKRLNINPSTGTTDLAIYQDTLYFLTSTNVHTLDIRPYRPLAKNTKTTIYPVFATNGDTIPLKQYCPDAHTLIFGLGFDKPDWLSINATGELEIASDAVTETTPVLVKLTGINYIDAADFEFYLIVEPATAPVWRDVDNH